MTEKNPKRFLVRILDLEGYPLSMRLVESPEEGVGIYISMDEQKEFLEDEDMFTIEQGPETIYQFAIRRDACST